jgi:IclR family KDG regulon transcriptional repressor
MPIIQAVERALKILDLFDDQTKELKITEISARMNLHKSTIHSLLKTLRLNGYIDQSEETGQYRLGMKLLEKGQLLLQGLDIRTVAKPFLQQLSNETGQTTHLVIMDGAEGVYIDKVEGEKAPIRYSRIGRRVPIHSSAVGKLLAAYQPSHVLERLISGYVYRQHTPKTISDEQQLRIELEQVRAEGVAYDREENEPGVRCAAAPIFNHYGEVIAAMSISTMITHVDETELKAHVQLLRNSTQGISHKLGFQS